MNLVMEGQLAHEEELGMAKHGKLLPGQLQRDRPQNGDSVLLRSAESIGRVIGTLQRQLDGARDRLSGIGVNREASVRDGKNGRASKQKPKATTGVRRTAKAKSDAAEATKAAEAKVSTRKSTKRTRKAAASKNVKSSRAPRPRR